MHSGYGGHGGDFASSTGYDDEYDDDGRAGGEVEEEEEVPNRKSVITFETPEDEDDLEREVRERPRRWFICLGKKVLARNN